MLSQLALPINGDKALANGAGPCFVRLFSSDHCEALAGPDNIPFTDEKLDNLPRPDRDDLGRRRLRRQNSFCGLSSRIGTERNPGAKKRDDQYNRAYYVMRARRLPENDLTIDPCFPKFEHFAAKQRALRFLQNNSLEFTLPLRDAKQAVHAGGCQAGKHDLRQISYHES
ncbi:hypothetical protein [Sphingosinicella sp.]|uniref:hypothetical protein n=1 Tax=Sphingosinicella sp. TaxID=1917971 RepID=UPI0040380152